MKILLNEKKIIEDIIESGFVGDKPMSTVHKLAKYYVAEGKTKDEVMVIIDEYLTKNWKDYNSVLKYDKIEDIVKQKVSSNKSFINVDSVNITKSEIEFINNSKKKFKRIMFSYLVYSKILNKINPNNDGWISGSHRPDVFEDANIGDKGRKQVTTIREAINEGIFEMKKESFMYNGIKPTFINEDDEIIWVVDDFRELGLQYLEKYGTDADKSKICTCEQCGIKFKYVKPKLGGRPKLNCDKCLKENKKNSSRKAMNKLRKKKDME